MPTEAGCVHRALPMFLLRSAIAQESCRDAVELCVDGEGAVVESKAMLALKRVSKVATETDEESEGQRLLYL